MTRRPEPAASPHVHVHVAGTLPGGGTAWGDVPRLAVAATDVIAGRLRPHLGDRAAHADVA